MDRSSSDWASRDKRIGVGVGVAGGWGGGCQEGTEGTVPRHLGDWHTGNWPPQPRWKRKSCCRVRVPRDWMLVILVISQSSSQTRERQDRQEPTRVFEQLLGCHTAHWHTVNLENYCILSIQDNILLGYHARDW